MQKALLYIIVISIISVTFSSCSITKKVPEDKYLLNKVKIESDSKKVNTDMLYDYLKQTPNNYFLGMGRLKLALYNASKNDSTKRINRWLEKVGEPPVIYDVNNSIHSKNELEKVLFNNGYMNSKVDIDVELNKEKQKAKVTYKVTSNRPYTINNFIITLPNDTAFSIIKNRKNKEQLKGKIFNVDDLDKERENIATALRNQGYYNFRKELLFYAVDTGLYNHKLDIELAIQPHYLEKDSVLDMIFERKIVEQIEIHAYKDKRLALESSKRSLDTLYHKNITVYTEREFKTFRPKALINKVTIKTGKYYNEKKVERTYSLLNSLNAVKYVNISFKEIENGNLKCIITVSQDKPHSISGEFELTYSGGNFGTNVGIAYQNNNIFRGSETLNIGVGGGYEMLSNISDNNFAAEISANASLRFPTLLFPFNKSRLLKNNNVSTEVGVNVDFQKRPEYQRNIANAGIKYIWKYKRINFFYNLVDISYIYLPWMDEAFKDKYLNPSSSIRFSYEDHFIMRMGLGISTTNKKGIANNYYTVRANVVTAGNLLYGLSHLFNQKRNDDGNYNIFNIQYSQYVKADVDYSYNIFINPNIRLVLHGALGVGVPYANASVLPFEERYYSGGANSVRGWSIRTLGPGTFRNSNSTIDFMRQSGDIKLDLNIESRFKIFWKLEGAIFLDAGNIWTIRDYKEQPGGFFKFNEFYKQIGMSYGLGLRANFSFFIIRLDMGIKLYDPGYEDLSDRWRTSISWKDDFAIHFAVGYPF